MLWHNQDLNLELYENIACISLNLQSFPESSEGGRHADKCSRMCWEFWDHCKSSGVSETMDYCLSVSCIRLNYPRLWGMAWGRFKCLIWVLISQQFWCRNPGLGQGTLPYSSPLPFFLYSETCEHSYPWPHFLPGLLSSLWGRPVPTWVVQVLF